MFLGAKNITYIHAGWFSCLYSAKSGLGGANIIFFEIVHRTQKNQLFFFFLR